jgi:broad specificity phosphatase PhoE
MNIYLLRHGRTSWNHEQRLQGITDTDLDRVGVWQSWRAAHWIRKAAVPRILTSPLRRARRTANIVHALTLSPVSIDERLHEIDHGLWAGLTVSSIERRFPAAFAEWRFSPETLRLASAETLQRVYSRTSSVLSSIVTTETVADLLIVSHGVINALLICAALGAPLSRLWEFSQNNGSLSVLRVERRQIVAVEKEIDVATW